MDKPGEFPERGITFGVDYKRIAFRRRLRGIVWVEPGRFMLTAIQVFKGILKWLLMNRSIEHDRSLAINALCG
jgi:hypothetical protein